MARNVVLCYTYEHIYIADIEMMYRKHGLVIAVENLKNIERKIYTRDAVSPNKPKGYVFFKRLFDLLFSLFIGILSLPVMLVIAVLIRLTSPGKAIYKQERLGLNGKKFYIYASLFNI